MRKVRIILWSTVIVLLLLALNASAQHGGQYLVEAGTASGGSYQLTTLSWQVSGTTSGGSYRLLCPAGPSLRGSGCCCIYSPMTMRSFTP